MAFTNIGELPVDIELGALSTFSTETLLNLLCSRGIQLLNYHIKHATFEQLDSIGYAGTLGASSLLKTSGNNLAKAMTRLRRWPPGLDSLEISFDEPQVEELIRWNGVQANITPMLEPGLIGCRTVRSLEMANQSHFITARLPMRTNQAHRTMHIANVLKPMGFDALHITNENFVAGDESRIYRHAAQSPFIGEIESSLGINTLSWLETNSGRSVQLVEGFGVKLANTGVTDPFDSETNPAGLFLGSHGWFGSKLRPSELINTTARLTSRHGFMGILEEMLRLNYPGIPPQIRNN